MHPVQVCIRAMFAAFVLEVALVLMFDLAILLEMLAVGTLAAYAMVAASLLIVRYG